MIMVLAEIIIPYLHFVSPFFQIAMFYFCAFVRRESLGGFLLSASFLSSPSASENKGERKSGKMLELLMASVVR